MKTLADKKEFIENLFAKRKQLIELEKELDKIKLSNIDFENQELTRNINTDYHYVPIIFSDKTFTECIIHNGVYVKNSKINKCYIENCDIILPCKENNHELQNNYKLLCQNTIIKDSFFVSCRILCYNGKGANQILGVNNGELLMELDLHGDVYIKEYNTQLQSIEDNSGKHYYYNSDIYIIEILCLSMYFACHSSVDYVNITIDKLITETLAISHEQSDVKLIIKNCIVNEFNIYNILHEHCTIIFTKLPTTIRADKRTIVYKNSILGEYQNQIIEEIKKQGGKVIDKENQENFKLAIELSYNVQDEDETFIILFFTEVRSYFLKDIIIEDIRTEIKNVQENKKIAFEIFAKNNTSTINFFQIISVFFNFLKSLQEEMRKFEIYKNVKSGNKFPIMFSDTTSKRLNFLNLCKKFGAFTIFDDWMNGNGRLSVFNLRTSESSDEILKKIYNDTEDVNQKIEKIDANIDFLRKNFEDGKIAINNTYHYHNKAIGLIAKTENNM